jgi:hypothetical protein
MPPEFYTEADIENAQSNAPIDYTKVFRGSTYTETELGKLLLEIWENRNWFSINDIDALRNQLREDKKI